MKLTPLWIAFALAPIAGLRVAIAEPDPSPSAETEPPTPAPVATPPVSPVARTPRVASVSPAPATEEPQAAPKPSITIGGYVETYYQLNFRQPSNHITNLRGFDNRERTFTLSNAAIDAKGGHTVP